MATGIVDVQSSLPGLCLLEEAVARMSESGAETRGQVFTRREVVEFILDLAGYTPDKPLHRTRLLEPSTGQGDFLLPVVERLLDAYRRHGGDGGDLVADLGGCILAVELHRGTYERARAAVSTLLLGKGLQPPCVAGLCDRWLVQGDFLLMTLDRDFTHIIGNPPYVRLELVPNVLMAEYRRRYRTMYDRADLYVAFVERSLSALAPGGSLGFICADRWTKNRYGGPLRRVVAEGYHLKHYVDMVDTDAFLSDVVAYPAIVVIDRRRAGPTRVASRPAVDGLGLASLARAMNAERLGEDGRVTEVDRVALGTQPWILEAPVQLALVRRLEEAYPTLEQAGCQVGIGVATGADQAFIGPYDVLDVEPDRKLPLVMTRDIVTGSVKWRGQGVVNPFGADGRLVSLDAYPRLAKYLETNVAAIKARHVARKNPRGWYRTIDRIYPELTGTPKLLIPDIKGEAHVVWEGGELYPHHNLYFVTSTEWDLHALQAVLLSDVTRTTIGLYSTKMRGGYLRFQAQHLRRLRLPRWYDVPEDTSGALVEAGLSRIAEACNAATAALYRLTSAERHAMDPKGIVVDAA